MAFDRWLVRKVAQLFYWRYQHTLHEEAYKWWAMAEIARRQRLMNRLEHCGHAIKLEEGVEILAPERVWIGDHVAIGRGTILRGQGGIHLSDFVVIGDYVVLATAGHPVGEVYLNNTESAPIQIGENVWIAAGAIILPNVTIGANAVIAAGAVVTENVPPNTLVGGVPARILKEIPVNEAENERRKQELRLNRAEWDTRPPRHFR